MPPLPAQMGKILRGGLFTRDDSADFFWVRASDIWGDLQSHSVARPVPSRTGRYRRGCRAFHACHVSTPAVHQARGARSHQAAPQVHVPSDQRIVCMAALAALLTLHGLQPFGVLPSSPEVVALERRGAFKFICIEIVTL